MWVINLLKQCEILKENHSLADKKHYVIQTKTLLFL